MDWLIEISKEYGLFVALVVYVLWTNQKREERYIDIIEKLSKSFDAMKRDIHAIKDRLFRESGGNDE